jgi:hypothetical protein
VPQGRHTAAVDERHRRQVQLDVPILLKRQPTLSLNTGTHSATTRPSTRSVASDRVAAALLMRSTLEHAFIEEVDGILLYVCPKCRKEFEKIDVTLPRR